MNLFFQALSPTSTFWRMRQHYALDTAALLLAGADPTSIDTEQPETVLVSQAIYSFKYHREAESWRSRLVYAGLCGELSVSIDNQLGFVAAWENGVIVKSGGWQSGGSPV